MAKTWAKAEAIREKTELVKAVSGACFLFRVYMGVYLCWCGPFWQSSGLTGLWIIPPWNWSALKDCLAQKGPHFSRRPSEAATDTGRWVEVLGSHSNQSCSPCSCLFISCLCIQLDLCKSSIAKKMPIKKIFQPSHSRNGETEEKWGRKLRNVAKIVGGMCQKPGLLTLNLSMAFYSYVLVETEQKRNRPAGKLKFQWLKL